ncbi:nucleoside deaminase [Vallicoccus soli]|uniref:Nucleoside deaminase n=1 Tax=Vallicoccus soli TaxID=2339232 RepID=A0A3A3Z398_9ACTN|nr:nucleoside deaminase [Vallicoccus soli]RJK94941.1 nucleoside deaminase [Vallicoccus soli]
MTPLGDAGLAHLHRCLELAEEALEAGDDPFGSVLVDAAGVVRFEDRNRVAATGDPTQHPEIAAARWAAVHLDADERAAATVYTSGEHCPMCAAAHGWAGLGRIVCAATGAQLAGWLAELGAPVPPVRTLAVTDVAPGVEVVGPVPPLDARARALHVRRHRARTPVPGPAEPH